MSMSWLEISEQGESFFDAFNILGTGLALVWIVGSFFLANAVTEKKDERVLATLMFVMFGGMIYFADDPVKWVFLVVAVCIVVYGMFKMLWRKKEYNE